MLVKIKTSNESALQLTIEPEQTVLQLKEAIAQVDPQHTPPAQQRLIFSGRVMKDGDTLASMRVQDGNTIHMVRGAVPSGAGAGAPAGAAPPTSTTRTSRTSTTTTTTTVRNGDGPPVTTTHTTASVGGVPGLAGLPGMGLPFAFPGMPAGAAANPFLALLQQQQQQQSTTSPLAGLGASPLGALAGNPAMLAHLTAMMGQPGMLDLALAGNPELAATLTPELRAQVQQMLGRPEFLHQMLAMAPVLAQMGMGPGAAAPGGGGTPAFPGFPGFPGFPAAAGGAVPTAPGTAPGAGAANPLAAMMAAMAAAGGGSAGLGATSPLGVSTPPASATPAIPPEQLYATQLVQLSEMGFYSAAENLRALQATRGNVEAAVEFLLAHPPGM